MHSTSSLTREFLMTNPGSFTANQAYDAIRVKYPDEAPSSGGVSGFLSRAAKAGALSVANVDGLYTYAVTDKKKLAAITVREGQYAGGTEGRRINRKAARIPSTASIQSRLLDLAAELELARTPLAQFSTEELLAELGRRAGQKAA